MEDSHPFPSFDESDRELFSLKDARSRSDALQSIVWPKLRSTLRIARERLLQVYGPHALDDYREAKSPAHRKNGKRPMLLDSASSGLRHKDHFWLLLSFTLTRHDLRVVLETYRPAETSLLVGILRKHEDKVVDLANKAGCFLWWPDCPENNGDVRTMIRTLAHQKYTNLKTIYFSGDFEAYPFDSGARFRQAIFRFTALFAIFQAVGHIFAGTEERFEDYYQKFNDLLRSRQGVRARPSLEPPRRPLGPIRDSP